LYVLQAHIQQGLQAGRDGPVVSEERQGFADSHLQDVRDVAAAAVRRAGYLHFQDFATVAFAVALWTAQVNIAEELHLDMFEAIARAGGAAPVPGIEAEGAQGVAALLCQRFGNETPAYLIERADIGGGNGACGLADGT